MVDDALIEQLQRMARRAALRAGMVLCEKYAQPRKVKAKGLRDIVTDADSAAQLTAINAILERYPEHQFLAEEDIAAHPDEQGQWHIPDGIVWIIDPLDGTTNYASKVPLVSVSVGVAIDGEPVAGAIYDPLRDEMFEGAKGLGAMLNKQPLSPITPLPLLDSIFCLDWAHEPERRSRAVASASALAPVCRTLRALGSAALGLAYLASGRLQGYFHYAIQPWDCAAGAVIVREVGGQILRPDGEDWRLGDMELLAGHPKLIEEVVEIWAAGTMGVEGDDLRS
ncbi:MAG: inositol monophosphatase [Anaerolineae bacterium]|nr:inositol monophosphatase [Anaerolineae bacterium]